MATRYCSEIIKRIKITLAMYHAAALAGMMLLWNTFRISHSSFFMFCRRTLKNEAEVEINSTSVPSGVISRDLVEPWPDFTGVLTSHVTLKRGKAL